MNNDSSIFLLKGTTIKRVVFVVDYLQLTCDNFALSLFANIEHQTKDGVFRFPENGSRTALVALLGKRIENVTFVEDKLINLTVSSKEYLKIDIIPGKAYPECAELFDQNGFLEEW